MTSTLPLSRAATGLAIVRISLSAAHSRQDISRIIEALEALARRFRSSAVA